MSMTNVQSGWLVAGKWVVAAVVSLWASIPAAVATLLLFMVIDYALGLLRAVLNKTLCSSIGWRGLAKKIATVLLVVSADGLVKSMHLPIDVGTMVIAAFVMNEFISIVENCAELGVPIPPVLLDLLLRTKKMTGRGQKAEAIEEELEHADVHR